MLFSTPKYTMTVVEKIVEMVEQKKKETEKPFRDTHTYTTHTQSQPSMSASPWNAEAKVAFTQWKHFKHFTYKIFLHF